MTTRTRRRDSLIGVTERWKIRSLRHSSVIVCWRSCARQQPSLTSDGIASASHQPELFMNAVHVGHCIGKKRGVSGRVATARTPAPFPQSGSMKVQETRKDQSRRTNDRWA
jgi:hypothetical protein